MASSIARHTATLLIILCIVCSIESTRERSQSNRRRERPTVATANNLCEKGADMKLMCHCNHDHFKQKITDVDCVLLHEEFPQSDAAWHAFNSHPNIKHLQLTVTRHGYLGYLPVDVFRRQRDLQTVNIQYGNIREVPSYAFANLTRLHNISLAANQIEVVNALAFANHPALADLSLESNQVTSIDRFAFVNLPKLEELCLSHNNLTALPNDVFYNLTNLGRLRLNDNLLMTLTRDVFKGLGKLQQLDLSINSLRSLGDGVFAELWSLQELYLENNNLERISERTFDGLNNLRILNLQNNKIALLENGVFSTVPAVITLNLNNNQLEWLTYTTVLPIMDNLVNNTASVLSISENRFICDCRLRWIFDLHNQTKNKELRYSLERITCTLEHSHQPAVNDPRYQVHFETNPRHVQPLDFEITNDLTVSANHIDQQHRKHSAGGATEKVELLNLKPNNLPCEAVTDPTELPLQRESMAGFDVSKLFQSSGTVSLAAALYATVFATVSAIYLL